MTIFAPATRPLTLDILIARGVGLMSLAATVDPLRAANRVAGEQAFDWRLVSADGEPVRCGAGIDLPVAGAFDPVSRRDALVIVASFDVDASARPALLADLRSAARGGMAMGGVEAGVWLLARAGLLDGRRATTHWEDLDAFALAHPAIEVAADRFVVDGPRFTSGGAGPSLDMMLALIRARLGPTVAIGVASALIYDDSMAAEAPQAPVSMGRLAQSAPRVADAVRLMTQTLDAPVSVAALAAHVGASPRTLESDFARALSTTPGRYYLDLRLNEARRMLGARRARVAEIAAATGFTSASGFARAFRARFGEAPSAARARLTRSQRAI